MPFDVQLPDLRLRNRELFVSRCLVALALVKLQQIQMELDAVESAFGWRWRKTTEGSVVLLHCVLIAILQTRQFAANRMQSIVIRVQSGCAV